MLLKNAIKQGFHLSTPCPMDAQDLHPPCNKQESQPSPNDLGGGGKMGSQTHVEDSIDSAVHCADCSQLGKKVTGADGRINKTPNSLSFQSSV